MMLPSIPGLSLVTDGNSASHDVNIEQTSTDSNFTVPASSTFANCYKLEDFEQLNKVPDGSFGEIYVCKHKVSGLHFHAKKIDLTPDPLCGVPKNVLREICILNALNHERITTSHGFVYGYKLEKNYLLLDYCPHSLKSLINSGDITLYERSMIKSIMKQIFEGLYFIHRAKIIHGCLNSMNVKLTEDKFVKIGRFETACYFDEKKKQPPEINVLQYRAPELLLQSKEYTAAVDLWAAGCIFSELIIHKQIFEGNTDTEVLNKIFFVLGSPSEAIWPGYNRLVSEFKNGAYDLAIHRNSSQLTATLCKAPAVCTQMIKNLLLYFPNARLTSKECLDHEFFKEEKREVPVPTVESWKNVTIQRI